MEAIGIAASFIAIGQALLAGRHVVNLLQEIPKLGNELASLNNEIESLRAAVEAANTQGMIFHDNEIEGLDLRLARGQITDIANRLDKVRQKCTQVGQNGKIKPRKTRWFWMQSELQQCRDKARDARSALQLALVTLTFKGTVQMSLHIERLTLRSASHHDLGSASDFETNASKGDEALSSASILGNEFRNEEDCAIPGQVQTRLRQLSLMSADERPSDGKEIVGMDMVILEARFPGAGRCPQPCRCRCHSSRSSAVRYPSWIGTLIGSLSVTYDQRLLLGGNSECTELGCKGNKRSSATFGYQLPAWLCARFVSFQVYTDSFRELRSSLRSARLLPLNDNTILCIIMHDTEVVKGSMLAYGHLFPDDRDADGCDVMSTAMTWARPKTLEFLTELWIECLRKDTYHPNWFFAANRKLEDNDISVRERGIFHLIASHGEDIVDAPQTELHEAVDLHQSTSIRHDLQSIVTKYPWAIDQWNCEGRTPLTLAASNGNLHAARELVRLGCNIDQPDYDGLTPLMLASKMGHVDVVHYLLDAGCLVNTTSTIGRTALHFAANPEVEPVEGPGSIMQMLLSAGALVKVHSVRGITPLHYMAVNFHGRLTRQAAEIRIRLLLDAGADINALSHTQSERPLCSAIRFDQPEVAKCFIEFGAQVTDLIRKENLLHVLAKSAQPGLLQGFVDVKLPPMNVYQEDDWGETPWDDFIMVLYTPEWDLGSWRRPTSQEQEAFVTLYKKLRDRSLELDIGRLQRVRQHLEDTIYHGAMTVLESLIREKKDWKQWESLRTYETIRLQVREQMVDAALESVDENIEVLQEKIDASPWDQVSRWGPPKAKFSYHGHEDDTEF